ncbi:MAG: molybdopterin cofactor-binding domain-containing protein, partial [bacterium]
IQQALGYAISEEMKFDEKGRMKNSNFEDYKILSSRDMPEIESILVETHEPEGPFGAKAIAEIPMNGPAPAVANAVYDAIGERIRELPITAEKIHQYLHDAGESSEEPEQSTDEVVA